MAFGFSENMHPPKGWKPPARPNASFRASSLAQDWPAQFKYPPLPIDQPLAASIYNPPVLAPTTIDDVAARPAIPPRHSDPSPSVPTVNHSPFESPAPLASASSFTPLSSRAAVDQSPYWTQSHPSGSMPTFSNTSVNHPLSLDTVNISTAVHQNVHAPSTVATTPCLFASEQVDQFPDPAPLTGLPSSYAFSFTCDPRLQSIGTRYMTQQSDGAQYHPQYQNNYNHPQYTQSTPLVNAPQSFDTVNLPSVVHHGISAPSRIVPAPYPVPCEDVAQLSGLAPLTGLPNSGEFTFPCVPQPQRYNENTLSVQELEAQFQSDLQILTMYHVPSKVTLPPLPAPEQTTEVCPEDFHSLDDYFTAALAPGALEYQLGHHASDSDEAVTALVLSIIAPPRPVKKMKTSASTDASMATSVAQPTHGCRGSQASSSTHSISPLYAPAQSMPTAGPLSGQSSSTNHRGQKRSSNDGDLESDDEGHQKRPRLETTDGIERTWCNTCREWVAKDRMSIHNRSTKHSGVIRYFCRICLKSPKGCRGQSRKDSLKRHIILQHAHDYPQICETYPSILNPYHKNEGRQDWEDLLGPPQQ